MTEHKSAQDGTTRNGGLILVYGFLVVGSLFMLFPLVWVFLTALKKPSEVFAIPPVMFPAELQWQNFVEAWTSGPFNLFFLNSFLIASSTTIIVLSVSSIAGYAFAKLRFTGVTVLFVLVIATMMIPEQVTLIPVFLFLRDVGLIDTRLGVVLPMAATGFGTFLMRQYIVTIPSSLIDAARIDGCSEFGVFWRIILPLVGPPPGHPWDFYLYRGVGCFFVAPHYSFVGEQLPADVGVSALQ